MAVQLNIKDPVLIERVRDLARRDGQPVTAKLRAIIDKEWEAQEQERRARMEELEALLTEVRRNMPPELRGMSSVEIANSIYDGDEPDGFAR